MRESILQLVTRFRKHRYVRMEEGFNPVGSIVVPVYACKSCGHTLCLDDWQMKSLPSSMKYNCSGKH